MHLRRQVMPIKKRIFFFCNQCTKQKHCVISIKKIKLNEHLEEKKHRRKRGQR